MGELGARVRPRGVIHWLVPGSAERRTGGTIYDVRIAAGLRRLGHRVELHELAGRFPDPDDAARESAGRALAAAGRSDAVVVDGLASSAVDAYDVSVGASLLVLCHMPIAEESGLDPETRARLARAEWRVLARADRVVATSRYTARAIVRCGLARGRVGIVEPGTDPVRIRPASPAAGPVHILAVGSVTAVKGHEVLLRALSRLLAEDWRLTVVGDLKAEPGTARAVKELAVALGLDGRMDWTGEQPPDRVRSLLRRADLFVHAAFFESYGMALAEALAHGLPIVATRVGGVPETPAGRAARLVPAGDPSLLADALRPLLRSGAARAERAMRSREHASELSTWTDAAAAFAAELGRAGPLEPDGG